MSAASSRALELAAQLEEANDAVIGFARGLSAGQWREIAPGEQWPVGVVVHHVAVGHDLMLRWLGSVSRGVDIADDAASVDEANERHAREFADVGVHDTVMLLQANGARLADFLRGLDDAQLGRTAAFGPGNGMTVDAERMAEVATRHCAAHLANARAALGMDDGE